MLSVKKTVCVFIVGAFLFLFNTVGVSAAYNYGFTKTTAGEFDPDGYSITEDTAADSSGNLISVGYFKGLHEVNVAKYMFNSSVFNADNPSGVVVEYGFVRQNQSSGSLRYVHVLKGNGKCLPTAVAVDSNNNVYVVGKFYGTINFLGISLTSTGDSDGFIMKLSSTGSLSYVKKFGGSSAEVINDIAVDSSGNIVIAGSFRGTTNLSTNGTYNSTAVGVQDGFFAKYDTSGNFSWAKVLPGVAGVKMSGFAVAIDSSDNIYIAGNFQGSITFGSPITSAGDDDIFIAALNASGVFQWTKRYGGTDEEMPASLAVDQNGNIYMCGYFYGTTDLSGNNTGNFTSFGGSDGFVAKYTNTGTYIWGSVFGGTDYEYAHDLILDEWTHVYTTGCYQGTTNFDPSGTGVYRTSAGACDFFILKHRTTGEYDAILTRGGTGNDVGYSISRYGNIASVSGVYQNTVDFNIGGTLNKTASANGDQFVFRYDMSSGPSSGFFSEPVKSKLRSYGVAIDSSGYVYIVGEFVGRSNFNPGGSGIQESSGYTDSFFTKYSNAGVYQWSKNAIGDDGDEHAIDISVDSANNVYIVGDFKNTVNFNPDGSSIKTSNGNYDIYITKYNSAGTYQWTKTLGGSDIDRVKAVSNDASNNIYVAGYFSGTVDFNPEGSPVTITSASMEDGFVVKYDNTGTFQWVRYIAGSSIDSINAVTADLLGNVYVTGYFYGTANFNPAGAADNRTPVGQRDAFITKYNSAGTYQWTRAIGGPNFDSGNGIVTDSANNVYIGGNFTGTTNFNPGGTTVNKTAVNYQDAYIASYTPAGILRWVHAFGGNGSDSVDSVDIQGSRIVGGGMFENTVNFNPGGTAVNRTSAGVYDAFVIGLNTDGVYDFVKTSGGTGNDSSVNVRMDSNGNVFSTGYYANTANFNPDGTGDNKTAFGANDLFLTKYLNILIAITINNPDTTPALSKTITASAARGTLTMSVNPVGVTTCNASNTFVPYASTTFNSPSDNGRYVCYRAVDGGDVQYKLSDAIGGIQSSIAPLVSNIIVNGGNSISLTAGTNTAITITATITDIQGYEDIASSSVKFYLGEDASCTPNNLNCYAATCSLSNCSGDSCTATCNLNLTFYTEPSGIWYAQVSATDMDSETGSYTVGNITVLDLKAINLIQDLIDYGDMVVGQNSGSVNIPVTVRNIGNVIVDLEVSGTNMCSDYPTCSDSTPIPVGNQKYSMSTFTYTSEGTALTGTGVVLEDFDLDKSMDGTIPTKNLYWGIQIPYNISKTQRTGLVYINIGQGQL